MKLLPNGQDVALQDLGTWIKDKINSRAPGTIQAVLTSAGQPANTAHLPALVIDRVSSSGEGLQLQQLRIEYFTSDNPERQKGDALFHWLERAIAQALTEYNEHQDDPAMHIQTAGLRSRVRFPVLRIEFSAIDRTEI